MSVKILGIESSCDETAASVVEDGRLVLSNVISSQIDIHTLYGGVVPEIASRCHVEVVNQVVKEAIKQAGINKEDIDISCEVFGKKLESPLFITAITGGHPEAKKINQTLAKAAEEKRIALGVGSQRAAIVNPNLKDTYSIVREEAPDCLLLGNIGAPQIEYAEKTVEILDADILAIHLNPLQESYCRWPQKLSAQEWRKHPAPSLEYCWRSSRPGPSRRRRSPRRSPRAWPR